MDLTTTDKHITSEVSSFIRRRTRVDSDPVRTAALEIFQQLGQPGNKHEEYKYTPVTRELEKQFTFQQPSEALVKDLSVGEYLIPDVDANILVFINGAYSKEHSSIQSPSSEISIRDLSEALASKDVAAIEHFNRRVTVTPGPRQNRLAAMPRRTRSPTSLT